ncbi:MAG: adenosylcobinamide-phosphate synthase CbiB [Candidatus Heteroscillospira sp.]|jgi:adenosylcobinamide-phosphate synthase
MTEHIAALCLGFFIDLVLGDPRGLWHPVCGIGALITYLENRLRPAFPKTPRGEVLAGGVLAALVLLIPAAITMALVRLCAAIHPALGFAAESLICWQLLAARSLRDESMKVYRALERGNLPAARRAVSMIVGRDTDSLDEAGVTRAAVETVAENFSDGVLAPMLYMALGGAPLCMLYKAANTMDSMLGYKNDRYLYFGRCAALFDDVVNFIPARLGGFIMCAAAIPAGFDGGSAFRIFMRDRLCHASPNSAHTEAAMAGALHIRLAGDNWYFGKLVHKPTIGNDDRPVEPEDIPRANRLMLFSAGLALALMAAFILILR